MGCSSLVQTVYGSSDSISYFDASFFRDNTTCPFLANNILRMKRTHISIELHFAFDHNYIILSTHLQSHVLLKKNLG